MNSKVFWCAAVSVPLVFILLCGLLVFNSFERLLDPNEREHYLFTLSCNEKVVLQEVATYGYKQSRSNQYLIGNKVYTPEQGSVCELTQVQIPSNKGETK